MPLNPNENEYISPREYEKDTSKQEHKDSSSDDLYFAPVLTTPKEKFDFTVSTIQKYQTKHENFSKEMTLPPFTETSKVAFGKLTRALAALIIAINSIASNVSEINDNTIKDLLKFPDEPVPVRYLKMFEEFQFLFGEIALNENFHIPCDNDAKPLTAKNHLDYLLRPATTVTSTIDLANKIRDCIKDVKNFQIATIAFLNKKFRICIHFQKTEKFVFCIDDDNKKTFNEIDELCKYALELLQPNNASNSITNNPHTTFNSKNQMRQPSVNAQLNKRDSNCNNFNNELLGKKG